MLILLTVLVFSLIFFLILSLLFQSNSPWEDGVTRVDRRWVQLTVEEKNIVGPIRSKQEEDIVGLVRDQKVHCKSLIFSTCVFRRHSLLEALAWCVLQFSLQNMERPC